MPDQTDLTATATTGGTGVNVGAQELQELKALKERVEKGELVPKAELDALIAAKVSQGQLFTSQAYKGLQGVIASKDQDIIALTGKVGEYEKMVKDLPTLESSKAELEAKVSEQELAVNALTSKVKRAQTIMSKFPTLAEFEANGLIPEVTEEADLEQVLTGFATLLGAKQKAVLDQYTAGGVNTPPPPKQKSGQSKAQELMLAANKAMMEGKMQEYNRLHSAYLEALQTEVS